MNHINHIVAASVQESISICRWYPSLEIKGISNNQVLTDLGSIRYLKKNPVSLEKLQSIESFIRNLAILAAYKGRKRECKIYSYRAQLLRGIISSKIKLDLV